MYFSYCNIDFTISVPFYFTLVKNIKRATTRKKIVYNNSSNIILFVFVVSEPFVCVTCTKVGRGCLRLNIVFLQYCTHKQLTSVSINMYYGPYSTNLFMLSLLK